MTWVNTDVDIFSAIRHQVWWPFRSREVTVLVTVLVAVIKHHQEFVWAYGSRQVTVWHGGEVWQRVSGMAMEERN